MLDLFSLSVLALLTAYFIGFLIIIPCLNLFKGNSFEKLSLLRHLFANFKAITSLLSSKLSISAIFRAFS